jgi:malate dehydrogenase (quinone)
MITAGQRVQVMKKDPKKGGVLQFGTEVVTAGDGSIGALLGASPGASQAAPIMVGLLEKCFPAMMEAWKPKLQEMIPSRGHRLNENRSLMEEVEQATNAALKLA